MYALLFVNAILVTRLVFIFKDRPLSRVPLVAVGLAQLILALLMFKLNLARFDTADPVGGAVGQALRHRD